MANYAGIKATIDANIKQNNNQEITGVILNGVLKDMVTALGTNYQYRGVATPGSSPGALDANVFFLAGAGTYVNYGNKTIPQGAIGVLKYDGTWAEDHIDGVGNLMEMGYVSEDGLFFVDGNLNIGAEIIQDGFFAINSLTYREV